MLARDFRSRLGEIGLIGRDGATVVLVEVKARRDGGGDTAPAALGGRPRARRVSGSLVVAGGTP
jgi:Holliday junction resolvase-like predicted endonuclease